MGAHIKPKLTENVAAASRREDYGPMTYYCTSCARCSKRIEQQYTAEEFNVIDPAGDVRFVVSYKIECPHSNISVNFDRPGNINTNAMGPCYMGQTGGKVVECCATCVHGCEKIVRIDTMKRLTGKTKQINLRNCRIYRSLYRCIHPARSVEYDKGTYMSAYITCPNYKPK